MWSIIGGIVGALLAHVAIWLVRRDREARAERRRLELFATIYGVTPVKSESNDALRGRMNDVIRGVTSANRGIPAWLTAMQAKGESWMRKSGSRS